MYEANKNPNVAVSFDAPVSPAPHEVVFIEDNVPDLERLIAGVQSGVEVIVLDHTQNGLEQMAAALTGKSNLKALHLVTHGASGQLDLGSLKLNSANLAEQAGLLTQIGGSLVQGGDVLLYGCDVGQDLSFVEGLASLMGRDVAASNDLTGNVGKGGDWALETQTGHIETQVAFTAQGEADYQGVLATPVSTITLTEGPAAEPLPFPAEKVKIGFFDSGFTNPSYPYLSRIKSYYDTDPSHYTTSTISSVLTGLSGLDLAIIWFPSTKFSDAEIAAMQSLLDAGGRIYFNGEHNGYSAVPNQPSQGDFSMPWSRRNVDACGLERS
jgi:hypothetical protein